MIDAGNKVRINHLTKGRVSERLARGSKGAIFRLPQNGKTANNCQD
jgi:hypothetical protein